MDNMELINNPNYTYYYKSPIGLFFMRYNSSLRMWSLGMENGIYGNYSTTIRAADDVYTQHTGCYEWDNLNVDKFLYKVPTDIYEWERTLDKERT